MEPTQKKRKLEKMEEKKIDLEKLNRVLYVLGLETIQSLAKLNVFIYGLSGLGVEIGEKSKKKIIFIIQKLKQQKKNPFSFSQNLFPLKYINYLSFSCSKECDTWERQKCYYL